MSRLDKEREAELTPVRMEFAKHALHERGIHILSEDKTKLQFHYKGKKVTLFPYSGWHSGATIKDGRGIELLLKQLDNSD